MSIRSVETQAFGAPLTIPERVAAGLAALVGVAGHVVLGLAALLFFAIALGVV
ncbi:4-coumarate--CoA ligase family protein [Haloplanus aerogenes]|uniref:Uncharacterized protein n=1 Tax=Haloplanus aerogenes TaxID=660522 RepID=A0A3M0DSC4_9EURY|nr:4-coumarate--CoA ligase family protein [Haloplanus aerogenes]RMB25108.1 hypothetical protein ATH50_0191 [Haloplanus aerogenes]